MLYMSLVMCLDGSYLLLMLSFFFQAEDGILDAQGSRVLVDVYKRQPLRSVGAPRPAPRGALRRRAPAGRPGEGPGAPAPVSYTHLTLPTNYSV